MSGRLINLIRLSLFQLEIYAENDVNAEQTANTNAEQRKAAKLKGDLEKLQVNFNDFMKLRIESELMNFVHLHRPKNRTAEINSKL